MTTPPGFLTFNRENIYAALFALGWAAYAWQNDQTLARRLKLWGDVPVEARPAFYQYEGEPESYSWSQQPNPKVLLKAYWFIYTACKDPNVIGATLVNTIMDAVHNKLLPTAGGPMMLQGRQTLEGLVQYARIEGEVQRFPGDLDGDGLVIVPISISVNA